MTKVLNYIYLLLYKFTIFCLLLFIFVLLYLEIYLYIIYFFINIFKYYEQLYLLIDINKYINNSIYCNNNLNTIDDHSMSSHHNNSKILYNKGEDLLIDTKSWYLKIKDYYDSLDNYKKVIVIGFSLFSVILIIALLVPDVDEPHKKIDQDFIEELVRKHKKRNNRED